MASIIKPFCALHYNQKKVKNLSNVISPPYDVISPKQLAALRKKSSYNFSRVLLAKNNNYKEIGNKFRKWIKDGVLVQDKINSFYLYRQEFIFSGKKYSRFGILNILKMNKKGVVFPHEYTLKAPKKDRTRVIKEMKANLSPIFVIAPKQLKSFHEIIKRRSKTKPFLRFRNAQKCWDSVWKIEDKKDIKRICNEVDRAKLVIADGHHRFEVANNYYRQNKGRFADLNYILSYLTDKQKGLLVLPTHRVARVKDKDVFKNLSKYFEIKKVSFSSLKKALEKYTPVFSLGIYKNNKGYLLKLKKREVLDRIIVRPVFKKLDTYILQKLVFPLAGIEGAISYTHSLAQAKKMAKGNQVAFLLRPTPLKTVFDIANKGFRLPQKSTYFFPKVSCGVVARGFGL